MICVSTRGKAPAVSLREAVLAGIAPDGGLYVPSQIDPALPDSWWAALRGKSFHDVAIALAAELAGDEFDPATLTILVRDALNFPVPIVKLDDRARRARAVSRADVCLQGLRRAHAGAAAGPERGRARLEAAPGESKGCR